MSEKVTYSVYLPGKTASISIFPDDTIETIRMRIGMVAGMHPDRLRIYVSAELPEDYYAKDPRRWENVFLRLSPEGKILRKASLDIFAAHTDPAWILSAQEYDKASWMLIDSNRSSSFIELRMLGTPEEKSWFFPQDNTTEPPYSPSAAQISIESKSLFNSMHQYRVTGFKVIPHTEDIKPNLELLYYPLLRSGSPAVVPEEIARSIVKQDELLEALIERESPSPTSTNVLRARWKIPLVDTDMSSAPRNRFEQIFYGTSSTKTTPAISFFGSRQEQSRHKFFTENPLNKKPFVDLRTWQYWWTSTKPTKNKPSVLFFKGSARFVYDRITINPTEIIVSAHRLEDSNESIESLKTHLKEWLLSIDGLAAFVEPSDLDFSRWVVQDVSVSLKYPKELKEGDFRRFGCLRGIYEIIDHDKLLFKLLRADQADLGLNPLELRIVQMLKENEFTTPSDISEDLGIDIEEAVETITAVREKLEDNPDLLDKQYFNLPTFRFSSSSAVVTYAIDLRRITKYISILREILMNPNASDIDNVCPARMETIETATTEVIPLVQKEEEDSLDFLDELLGEIAQANAVTAPEVVVSSSIKPTKKITTKGSTTSLATYLLTQLRDFDPETYDPDDPQILRKCDRPRQPILLTPADMANLNKTEYDPKNGKAAVLDLSDPDGHVICPVYWCTYDRIPLTEEQIGEDRICPVCTGKIRSNDKAEEKKQDIIEYPVIQRDPSIVFPGYVKYKSKKNDRPIPCCFTTAQTTKVSAPKSDIMSTAEAFYVLGETKSKLGPLRIGYIPRSIGKAVGIVLNYKDTLAAGNRIQAGQSGFYRVGVGRASETLPQVIGFSGSIRTPLQNVDATMRCSFFRTWRGVDEEADEDIIPENYTYRYRLAGRVASIDKAYKEKMLTTLQELEYTALSLDCQLFILYQTNDEVQIGCFMNIGAVRSVNRAVAVMIGDAGDPEYISHVARITTSPQFTANLYKKQLFPEGILKKLIDLRQKACVSDIPTVDTTFAFINSLPSLKNRIPDLRVIMDPYGRAQAVFIPELVLLPFKPTSQIPTFLTEKITGFSDISEEDLPYKGDMLDFLEEGVRFHPGFEYAHDVGDRDGRVVELITKSGLRIPVQTDEYVRNSNEIVTTVRENGEDALVWGDPDPKMTKDARAITYEAEVFDFLLYQLSYDIQMGEDYRPLKLILSKDKPRVEEVKPLLDEWFDSTVTFSDADKPINFVQKMRSPCSKDDCTGNLCAWNGSQCKVEVRNVRSGLDREKLKKRMLSTLVSNEKIRDLVWQHKTSPFFSSVLYIELPTELIMSDGDISRRLK